MSSTVSLLELSSLLWNMKNILGVSFKQFVSLACFDVGSSIYDVGILFVQTKARVSKTCGSGLCLSMAWVDVVLLLNFFLKWFHCFMFLPKINYEYECVFCFNIKLHVEPFQLVRLKWKMLLKISGFISTKHLTLRLSLSLSIFSCFDILELASLQSLVNMMKNSKCALQR